MRFMNNAAGDGKDLCDLSASHIKAIVLKWVNSLVCNADSPRNFAHAIIRGDGMVDTVVMLGPIVGGQAILKEKEKKKYSFCTPPPIRFAPQVKRSILA